MSISAYHTQILLDAARCLVLAGMSTALGWGIGARLPGRLGWKHWAIIMAPLFTPALLVSYTFSSIALQLTGTPRLLVLFYSTLVALKFIPLAVIASRMFPRPISATAQFCEALVQERSLMARLGFRLRVIGPFPWMTGGVIFLLAFTDFELASLLSIKTWAVQLFDFHAGGLALAESVRRVILPVVIEVVAITSLVLFGRRATPGTSVSSYATAGSRWPMLIMGAIALVTSIGPIAKVTVQSAPGWRSVGVRETIGEEVMVSIFTAVVSTMAISVLLLVIRRSRSRLLLLLPGLLGALVLSLLVLAALNSSPPAAVATPLMIKNWTAAFTAIAESPLPLLFVETLLLAPVAVLLWVMLAMRRPGQGLHLARMAGSRRLIWELALEPRVASLALLFLLSYFEFTAASILTPVQLTPICVRLHNLAHYGQTPALSAMLFAAVMMPIIVVALTLGTARYYARQNVR